MSYLYNRLVNIPCACFDNLVVVTIMVRVIAYSGCPWPIGKRISRRPFYPDSRLPSTQIFTVDQPLFPD